MAVLLGALLVVLGCGGGVVKPKGQLVQGGKPLTVDAQKGVIVLSLYKPDDAKGADPFPAETKQDGSFVVIGKDGKGVPQGQYRVAVQALDPYPGNDKLKGKFAADKTSLTVDIKGSEDLTIDVSK